jgi:DNA-binding beta-propeller fold protein YncE
MSGVDNNNEIYASVQKVNMDYNHDALQYTSNTYPAYDPADDQYKKARIENRNRLSCCSGKSSVVDFSTRPLPPLPAPPKPLGLSSKANIPTPLVPPPEGGVQLLRTIRLDRVMLSSWVSGLAVTRKNELVVVDLRDAFLLDHNGNVKRNIGARGPHRLFEPIDVTVLPSGNIAFSDHAERDVKVFTSRGQFVRLVSAPCQTNIAGVAATDKGELVIAGTDRQVLTVHANDDGRLLRSLPGAGGSRHLEHPYSVAVNPLTGDILVGDDSKQLLTAMSPDGRILWRFCPSGDRHFFPSSVCVDDVGYVFVADLYNEKVYMLDSSGKFLKTLLSRGHGLKGGPGALAVDKHGHLYVADEERTIKVFKYGENGFALWRRFKTVPESDL